MEQKNTAKGSFEEVLIDQGIFVLKIPDLTNFG